MPTDPQTPEERLAELEALARGVLGIPTPIIGSHWSGCWREHHACAVALVERLQAEPRVHPLAMAVLHAQHDLKQLSDSFLGRRGINEDGTASETTASDVFLRSEESLVAMDAHAAWDEEGCPIYSPPIDPTDQTTHPCAVCGSWVAKGEKR